MLYINVKHTPMNMYNKKGIKFANISLILK